MFSRGIERDQWHRMGYNLVFLHFWTCIRQLRKNLKMRQIERKHHNKALDLLKPDRKDIRTPSMSFCGFFNALENIFDN